MQAMCKSCQLLVVDLSRRLKQFSFVDVSKCVGVCCGVGFKWNKVVKRVENWRLTYEGVSYLFGLLRRAIMSYFSDM